MAPPPRRACAGAGISFLLSHSEPMVIRIGLHARCSTYYYVIRLLNMAAQRIITYLYVLLLDFATTGSGSRTRRAANFAECQTPNRRSNPGYFLMTAPS